MTTFEDRAQREVDEMISESTLPEIDAVAHLLLMRAWLKGYAAAQEQTSKMLDQIGGKA